jgi:hypothetical protein
VQTADFCGGDLDGPAADPHGTAVAKVIHDMAPGRGPAVGLRRHGRRVGAGRELGGRARLRGAAETGRARSGRARSLKAVNVPRHLQPPHPLRDPEGARVVDVLHGRTPPASSLPPTFDDELRSGAASIRRRKLAEEPVRDEPDPEAGNDGLRAVHEVNRSRQRSRGRKRRR